MFNTKRKQLKPDVFIYSSFNLSTFFSTFKHWDLTGCSVEVYIQHSLYVGIIHFPGDNPKNNFSRTWLIFQFNYYIKE